MIPDLSDNAEMARRGRISALYSARAKSAEKARDIAVRMLNNLDNSAVWEPAVLAGYFAEIQEMTEMIQKLKEQE